MMADEQVAHGKVQGIHRGNKNVANHVSLGLLVHHRIAYGAPPRSLSFHSF